MRRTGGTGARIGHPVRLGARRTFNTRHILDSEYSLGQYNLKYNDLLNLPKYVKCAGVKAFNQTVRRNPGRFPGDTDFFS